MNDNKIVKDKINKHKINKHKINKHKIVYAKGPLEMFYDEDSNFWIITNKDEKYYTKKQQEDFDISISQIEASRLPLYRFFILLFLGVMGSYFTSFYILSKVIDSQIVLTAINLTISLFILFSLFNSIRHAFVITVRYTDDSSLRKEDNFRYQSYGSYRAFLRTLVQFVDALEQNFKDEGR